MTGADKAEAPALIVIAKPFVAILSSSSLTWTVKLTVPAVIGFPLITPPDESKDNPAGSAPPSDHL
jgi:hypothetical protein